MIIGSSALFSGCESAPESPPPESSLPVEQTSPVASAQQEAFEFTVDWSAEYDVIVIGFGGAGATAAAFAADEGAKVLLLEKAPEGREGGNTPVSAGCILGIEENERDEALKYFKSIRGDFNTPSDKIVETYVDGAIWSYDWIRGLGAKPVLLGEDGREFAGDDHFPGNVRVWFNEGIGGSPVHYQLIHKLVEERRDKIDVWYEAPGTKLIQDPATLTIHGVVAEVAGKEYSIRAKNGVVLCTGGFQNNIDMIQTYMNIPYAYPKGTLYNTGDGIKMAQAVGAELWHMGNSSGFDLNIIDENNRSYGYSLQGGTFTQGSAIFVGPDGTRYTNETQGLGHGYIKYHGYYMQPDHPFPVYCVFDSKAFETPIYSGALTNWGSGNAGALEKGVIIQADTLEELAGKLDIPEGNLSATVAQYNQFCLDGEDVRFGRDPQYLNPFQTEGPYYAVTLVPTFTNTLGGPVRDEEGRVIHVSGEPIPNLYSAGECGSIIPYIYQMGSCLTENMVFGRISGTNAAIPKSNTYQGSVMEGKTPVNFATATVAYETGANEYIGVANGIGMNLTVKVTMDGDKIAAVEILSHNETAGISDGAIEKIPAAIVEAQSTDVDVVTGATMTSNAIKAAVDQALAEAR
jgi:succinate dehydrogenase/fumarate reductase flavoprotein subunit/uncharacterized protein with FMN-binding domain